MNWQTFIQQYPITANAHDSITSLDDYAIIKVSGQDARSFLQGQLSCDINAITPQYSSLTAYCNIKGRIVSIMRVMQIDDCLYLRLPNELLQTVLAELHKYVLFAKVQLTEVTNDFVKIGICSQSDVSLATIDNLKTSVAIIPVASTLFELYTTNVTLAKQIWKKVALPHTATGHWQLQEIYAGIPEIYAATSGIFLPHYLNLPQLDAVSFNKGCYRGQEIVSRMHYRGNIKKQLHLITTNTKLTAGSKLYSGGKQHLATIVRVAYDLHQDRYAVLLEIDPQNIDHQLYDSGNQPVTVISIKTCN